MCIYLLILNLVSVKSMIASRIFYIFEACFFRWAWVIHGSIVYFGADSCPTFFIDDREDRLFSWIDIASLWWIGGES